MGLFSEIGKSLVKGLVDSGSMAEKSAAFKILKERFLNEDSIKTMLQVTKSVGFDYSIRNKMEYIRYEVERLTEE